MFVFVFIRKPIFDVKFLCWIWDLIFGVGCVCRIWISIFDVCVGVIC